MQQDGDYEHVVKVMLGRSRKQACISARKHTLVKESRIERYVRLGAPAALEALSLAAPAASLAVCERRCRHKCAKFKHVLGI